MEQRELTSTPIEPVSWPVIVSVRGEQYFDEIDPDATELMTEGTLQVLPNGLRVIYRESELTGMEGTTTAFAVEGPRVILTRSGTVNSQMMFEEGRQHTSLYETPYGDLTVDIRTTQLKNTLTEQGGVLEICYSIAVEQVLTGRNRFFIRVRRKM